ncbi:CAP domain-containing protein [Nocardiopsis sp. NPDC055551]|uniref:CAP domain-containing protein n=1 Tax=Nocardiopsis sp. NPDC006832 TaxID=3157188 RepID=UPI0033E47DD1
MSAREQRSLRDHPSSEYDARYDDEYDDDFDARGHGSARRKKRRVVPLVAGIIAVPVGLTLAGALVLNTVGEDGSDAADGASAVGEIGEGAVADDSQVPENAEDDDFFDEPTATPERAEPSGDSATLSAQATATFSPQDGEDAGSEGDGGGGNGDGGGGNGGGGGDGTTSNAGGPLANEVVNLVNSERSANGCEPVHVDDRLTAAAQEHSDDMAARDYMAHQSPDGEGPGERANRHGYDSWGAENVAKGQQSAEQVMDAWMNSEGHRANILNCDLQAIGVGEADRAWTQKFGYE